MKYYSEDETKEIRLVLEAEILKWYKVDFKKMFGCPCYTANGKLFVFLVTKGIVITRLGETEITKLSMSRKTTSFHAGNKDMKNWRQIPLIKTQELYPLMPFVKKSYEEALKL
jgi:hypothetical protein